LSDGRTYPQDECVEVDGEWYLSGEEPEQEDDEEDSDDVSEERNTVEINSLDTSGFRLLDVGEAIQAGDYCAGFRELDPRDRWFITGDEGEIVQPGSLIYVRFNKTEQPTELQKEQVNS
jgi:hypothetical protein